MLRFWGVLIVGLGATLAAASEAAQTVQTVKITALMQHTPPVWQERSNCQLQNFNKINDINQNKISRMNKI